MLQKNRAGGLFGFFRKEVDEYSSNEPISEQVIRQWLIRRLAKQVKVDASTIDTAQTFDAYGLDSIVAVQVSGDLEKLVEKRLSPALLFEYPSIDELSAYLNAELNLKEDI